MNILIVENQRKPFDLWVDGFSKVGWNIECLTNDLTDTPESFDLTLRCCDEFLLKGGDLTVVLDLNLGGSSLGRPGRAKLPKGYSRAEGEIVEFFPFGSGIDGICFANELVEEINKFVSKPSHPTVRVLFVIASTAAAPQGPLMFLEERVSELKLESTIRFESVFVDVRNREGSAVEVKRFWNQNFPESNLDLFEAFLDRVLHGLTGLEAHDPIGKEFPRHIWNESNRIFKWAGHVTEGESIELAKILRGCRGTKLTGYSALLLAIAAASRAGDDRSCAGRNAPEIPKAEDVRNSLESGRLSLVDYLPGDAEGGGGLQHLWNLLESLFEYDERHGELRAPVLTFEKEGFTIRTAWNFKSLRDRCAMVEGGIEGRVASQRIVKFAMSLPQGGVLWLDDTEGTASELARFGIRRSESGVDFVFGFFE